MLEDKRAPGNDVTPRGLEADIMYVKTTTTGKNAFTDIQVERSPNDRTEPQGLIKPPQVPMNEPPIGYGIGLTPVFSRGEANQELEDPDGDERDSIQ